MTGLLQDVRYALRQLRKSPGFIVVTVITLALGIGANTAIYTLLDDALLRALPVKEPNRLALLRYSGVYPGDSSTRNDEHLYFSYPMYRDLRDHNSVFSGLIATAWAHASVQWHNEPELVEAELVSGNYFDVLGVQAALGRLFVPSDDLTPGGNPVVVLSFDYWKQRFGADPGIVNRSISINAHPFVIIGVAQPGFHSVVGGDDPAIFAPMMMKPEVTPGLNNLDVRRAQWLNMVGRLKPGVSREQAQAGIDSLWHSIRTEELPQLGHSSQRFKDAFLNNSHLFLDDGSKGIPVHGAVPKTLMIVMGMAGLMLLMACANVGSLMLVRIAVRTREISVRYALGAQRARLLQQLLVEGMMLGIAGGVAGFVVALPAFRLLTRALWAGAAKGLAFSSTPNLRIFAFGFALSLLATLFFSLMPALQFWHLDVTPVVKQESVSIAGGPQRLRQVSVVAQIGLSLLLLAGAGLFARTLHNLRSLDVGIATDHLVTFTINPRLAGYQPSQIGGLFERVLERLSALPGVRFATATNNPELADTNSSQNLTIAGYRPTEGEDMNVERENVGPRYFSTLKMPLLAGREVSDQDRADTQKIAVVNQSFARHYFGQPQNAVGRYFGWGAGLIKIDTQIVGVVKDAKHGTVRGDIRRAVFTAFLQDEHPGQLVFYVRTWEAPEKAEGAIRQAMRTLDSNLVLNNFRTMQEQIDENLTDERVIAYLASSFGVLAALMSAIGIYGVLAFSTAQRMREIGIRIALGATRPTVLRLVLMEVLWLVVLGIAVGLPVSLLLTRAIRSQLFGVTSSDPLTLCVVILAVSTLAFAAAGLPARNATKVDPMVALRYE